MKLNLAITGVGMVSPVGLGAAVCMHSIRAGITRLVTQPYRDRIGKWVVGGGVMERSRVVHERRLAHLAQLALTEALQQACGPNGPGTLGPIGIILGTAEPIRPGYKFPKPGFNIAAWAKDCGVQPLGPCEVVEAGNCSTQLALARAAQLLDAGSVRSCIVGAADTLLQARVIRWLESFYRLKCTYMNDGLPPGEAACFLVVEKEKQAQSRNIPILARLLATASTQESANVLGAAPNTARGLTDAVRTVLGDAGVPAAELGCVWSDLNGESYRAREWAFTEVRNGVQTHTDLMHPADCHGDPGAASDAHLLALATLAQATVWANHKPQLVFAGSESGIRAATLIAPPAQDPPMLTVTREMPRVLPVDVKVPPLGADESNYLESPNPPRTYFNWAWRQEHLENLAALYYQRRTLFSAGAVRWQRAREPEQRMLNHVDAVVAGGSEAIWAVASGLVNPELGTCFAGAFLLGLLGNHDNLVRLDDVLKQPDGTNLDGIEAGLRHVPMTPMLQKHLDAWIDHDQPKVRALAIRLASYHRSGDPVKVVQFPQSKHVDVLRASLVACRRYRYLYAIPAVQKVLAEENVELVGEALLTLLCLGAKSAPDQCRTLCRGNGPLAHRAGFLLALKGIQADLPVILKAGGETLDSVEKITALGVLGNLQALPFLLEGLKSPDEKLKVAAATALDTITGAGLREQAEIIEVTDLLDGEFAEDKRIVKRVATAPEVWVKWWHDNRPRFHTRTGWRHGKPIDPGTFLGDMQESLHTYDQRTRACHELVIHTDHDIPFEADWFVPRQIAALGAWQKWWEMHRPK